LQIIIELLERGKDEVRGSQCSQMVQHLLKNIVEQTQSKPKYPSTSRCIDPMLLELIEAMQGVWETKKVRWRRLKDW